MGDVVSSGWDSNPWSWADWELRKKHCSWWVYRGFLPLTVGRGICISCCFHFHVLGLWEMSLIFLAGWVLSALFVRLSWKGPWKPLPSLKVSELEKEKLDIIIYLFIFRLSNWEGGRKASVCPGGLGKLVFLNQKKIPQKHYITLKILPGCFDLMISGSKY